MNNIKEGDFRQKLISLLMTDKEIQKIILTIIDETAVDSTEFVADNDKEQIANLKKLVDELKTTNIKQGKELEEASFQIAELRAECLELKKYCEHAETNRREQKEKIQALLIQLEEKEQHLVRAIQQVDELHYKNDSMKQILEKTQQEYDKLVVENQKICLDADELQEKLDCCTDELEILQKTLKQRFDRGGEIYTRYQSCKAKLPLQVENVIRREGFEAFIVGLAQPDALEQLWEAARDAVLQKHDDTEKVLLWDMFTYSMELINQTVAEPLYELETVEKGDAYDMERHTTVRGSRIQGNVTEVIFPGYRNLHTGRIEPTLIRI